jgi:hypothetical protein
MPAFLFLVAGRVKNMENRMSARNFREIAKILQKMEALGLPSNSAELWA